MPDTYKNTSDRTIRGIEPGKTGELEDAAGFVGPGALEPVKKASKPRDKKDD